MKNYLFKSLFKITDPNWAVVDRSHETNLYNNYVEMHQYSLASYKKHLGGEWDFKFTGGNCDNIHQAFERTFWAIHDLWHREPCNIFYTDPDTIAVKAVDPWGKYSKFTMFNYTDPREFNKPNVYNRSFKHFFNAGVRYFPASMDPAIWKMGKTMAQTWDHTTYDTEQIILNAMMWDQGVALHEVLDPEIAWQWFTKQSDCETWNNCSADRAKIYHLHSSRGAENRMILMKNMSEKTV
jgi:hypothetical protein